MSGRGTLFSWVVVTHPFLPQFADLVPFVPALVALDEDPAVRIPTRIVDTEPGGLEFEMPVQVTFRPIVLVHRGGRRRGRRAALRAGMTAMTVATPAIRDRSRHVRGGRAQLVGLEPRWGGRSPGSSPRARAGASVQGVFVVAVALHVGRGRLQPTTRPRAGFGLSANRWVLQTLAVGFPSLDALKAAIAAR